MMLPIQLQAIAETFATGILVCIAGGIPIALFAWAALRVSVGQSSGGKFAVLYTALLAISLLPLIERIRAGAVYSVNSEPTRSLLTVSSSWAVLVFAVWSVFAAIALLRIMTGLMRLRRLRRSCSKVDAADLDPILQETLAELGCERGVELRVSDELSVPTAIGFFKPLVILPAWVLQDLSASQLRPVLLHELAHVRRWDDWTNLLQKVIQAILFFHPAVWWIEKRISLEREMACDDMVLVHTGNPRAYAESLLSVAERSLVRRRFSLAQAAVSRMRQTSARIAQILDKNRKGTMRIWKPASLLLATTFILAFGVLPQAPNLIGFSDKAPVALTAANFSVGARTPEQPIQIATAAVSIPRREVRKASFKTKSVFAPARSDERNVVANNLVEAKFPHGERCGSPLQSNHSATTGQALATETFWVVTRFQRDNQSPAFWTIHVWQLTVYKPATATQNTLPAKKV